MMKNQYLYFITILFLTTMNSCVNSRKNVDLVIHNAIIYQVDSAFSIASAMAINQGKFVAVGSDQTILDQYSGHEVIDAEKAAIYPGFNDGHSHFLGYGLWLTQYANLVGAESFDQVLDLMLHHHENSGEEWVLGRGWDQNLWEDKNFPDNTRLDQLFPNNPVVLIRIDGHAVLANSAALKRAGIDKQTTIAGGEIKKTEQGLTGILLDNAADHMKSFVPKPDSEQKTKALLTAQEKCLAKGLTTVTDAGLDKEDIFLIDSLQKSGILKIKVYAMLNPTDENLSYFLPAGPLRTPHLTVSSIKLYADGALGSRGALMIEPYTDEAGNRGLQLVPTTYYDSLCGLAYESGFQVNTHAIGDQANRLVIDVYAKHLKGKNDRRWRIEHAQVIHPDDLHRFGQYAIIPSIQSTHCTSDMDWADERLGAERIKSAYAYQDLLNENGWLVNGTDFPIEDIDPLHSYYAAISRKHPDGSPAGGFQPENALSRSETLYSITLWPAKGSFDEKTKGSIEAGKVADFVILNNDLMTLSEHEILKTKVRGTWVDGVKQF